RFTNSAEALYSATIVKEYSINVENGRLSLTFTPSPTHPKAYAFVNGIGDMYLCLIFTVKTSGTVLIVGQSSPFTVDNTTALENNRGTSIRLNVGGNYISPSADTGMHRPWVDDSPYLFAAAKGVTTITDQNTKDYLSSQYFYLCAPVDVYSTARTMGPDNNVNLNYNLTWVFSVDSGFFYLVRHSIFVRLLQVSRSNYAPVFKDYVVMVPSYGDPQKDLWLQLHPHKPNPVPAAKQEIIDPSLAIPGSSHVVLGLIIGFFVVLLLSVGVGWIVFLLQDNQDGLLFLSMGNSPLAEINANGSYASSLLSNCRHFSFADEIKAATREFDESLVLGVGGFGKVYKGEIDGGTRKVAIKRGNPLSEQGVHEFQTEIEMLSKLRGHRHLVS
ncbi:Receptor-like protein kinase FERONIA, partial [Cucurbita argyrosperma subsp. sororia]